MKLEVDITSEGLSHLRFISQKLELPVSQLLGIAASDYVVIKSYLFEPDDQPKATVSK